MSEELEKLRHKQCIAERKLTAAKHKEKRLQNELKRLTRSERTHRLCTRAGMLETFLKEPTVLTDEDVMELLTFIFQSETVQKKLNLLIESRRETLTTDGSENPFFNKGAIIHHLKVVHCVLPKGLACRLGRCFCFAEVSTGDPHHCMELMISAKVPCSIHPEEAELPLR